MKRSDSWENNQKISLKIYEELCDLKGIHPHGGNQRCDVCMARTNFKQKNQGIYSWTLLCSECKHQISPLSLTIFRNTNVHLSVWMKALYILKIKQPDIYNKDLAPALGVAETTSRVMKRKVLALKKNSFEILLLKRMEKLLEANYYFIFNEHPGKENPDQGFRKLLNTPNHHADIR